MKKSKFMLACAMSICAIGTLGHANAVETIVAEEEKYLEITIANFSEIATSYSATYTHNYKVGDNTITVEAYGVFKNGGIQMNKGKGTYIKNKTALPGSITRITTSWTVSGKNSETIYVAKDAIASTKSTNLGLQSNASTEHSINVNSNEGYNYFYFDGTTVTGGCVMTSFKIYYTEAAEIENASTLTFKDEVKGSKDVTVKVANDAVVPEDKIPADLPSFVDNGKKYTFTGWGTKDEEGNLTPIAWSDAIFESDTTIYAMYDSVDVVTITFANCSIEDKGVVSGETLARPENPVNEDKTKKFDDFYADELCTVKFDFSSVITKNTTIYANWIENVTSCADLPDTASTSEYIVQVEVIAHPKLGSYILQDATGTACIYNNGKDYDNIEVGNTLKIKGKTLALDKNNGTRSIDPKATITVISDDKVIDTAPITNIKDVTKSNAGKYVSLSNLIVDRVDTKGNIYVEGMSAPIYFTTNSVSELDIDDLEDLSINVTGYVCVYNTTLEVVVSEITVNANFVKFINGETEDEYIVSEGSTIDAPTDVTDYVENGKSYKFKGWYSTKVPGEEDTPFDFENTIITSDLVLYAVYDVEDLYTVTFMNGTKTVSTIDNVAKGGLITAPTGDLYKKGEGVVYTFIGWYKDEACTDEFNFTVDTISKDTVLYAGFEETPYLDSLTARVNFEYSFDGENYSNFENFSITYTTTRMTTFNSNVVESGIIFTKDQALYNSLVKAEGKVTALPEGKYAKVVDDTDGDTFSVVVNGIEESDYNTKIYAVSYAITDNGNYYFYKDSEMNLSFVEALDACATNSESLGYSEVETDAIIELYVEIA